MNERAFIRRLNSALPKEKRRPLPPPPERPIHPPRRGAYITDTLETLTALSPRNYAHKVTSSVGQEHEHLWPLFLDEGLIRYTHAALIRKRSRMHRMIKADGDPTGSRAAYLQLVEERLQQVELHSGSDSELARAQHRTIRNLTDAIEKHKQRTAAAGVLPEEWDRDLWDTLAEIRQMAPGRISE